MEIRCSIQFRQKSSLIGQPFTVKLYGGGVVERCFGTVEYSHFDVRTYAFFHGTDYT